eukprot:TCONS_00000779-protein
MAEDEGAYERISSFLNLRNIGHLLETFKVHKIDDTVLKSVDDLTLANLGLAYGDVIAFKLKFKESETNPQKTYESRLQNLKDKMNISRQRTDRKDAKNRSISVKNVFKMTLFLKCFEKKYVRKSGEMFETTVCMETSYDKLHNEAKEHFGIDKTTNTFLASYNNETYQGVINKMGQFIALNKEKKKQLVMYLMYPKTYGRLEYERNKENSILQFCDVCDKEFVGFCVYCAAQQELEQHGNYNPLVFDDFDGQNDQGDGVGSGRSRSPILSGDGVGSGRSRSPLSETASMEDVTSESTPVNSGLLPSSRQRSIPLRYRHSIGSPGLTHNLLYERSQNPIPPPDGQNQHPLEKEDQQKDSSVVSLFGQDEMDRFFENLREKPQNVTKKTEEEQPPIAADISTAYDEFVHREKEPKNILVQRDKDFFWQILFSQEFNLSCEEPRVRFAGESGADEGGVYREFLTLAMKNLSLSNLFIGEETCLGITCKTEAILDGWYHIIGQLIGASILINGRGPECFHDSLVRALFDIEQPLLIEPIDDASIKNQISHINQGNYDTLYDYEINPSGKEKEELIRLYMIAVLVVSKSSAIEQLKGGICSISKNLLLKSNLQEMKNFLVYSPVQYSFEQFISQIEYPQNKIGAVEVGSNLENEVRRGVADFELILLNIGQGKVFLEPGTALRYTDLLYFITGCDRIPSWGLPKKIEVDFDPTTTLPHTHTCGSLLHLPFRVTESQMVVAINFGGGFGKI